SEGQGILRAAGVDRHRLTIRRRAEMRYVGQGHEVEVELPEGALDPGSLAAITASFEAAYRALYSRTPMGVPIEALNWRVVVAGPAPETLMSSADRHLEASADPIKKTRPAYFPESGGYVDTPVYDRYALRPGKGFDGPAIIEERESTAVVGPGARISVDP